MQYSHKIVFALHLIALPLLSTHASAQIALGNGVTVTETNTRPVINGAESIDLGTSAPSGWVTQMPMSLSYASTNVAISFGATSGVYSASGTGIANPDGGNLSYFTARIGSNVTMDFSGTQRYFSTAWGTPDAGNQLQFYNGANLVASMTGQQFINGGAKAYAEFSFAEVGFTRVVASNTSIGGFEFANVSFDEVAPAPIPLGSLGGLASFVLGMLGFRGGKGGKRASAGALHLAFANRFRSAPAAA